MKNIKVINIANCNFFRDSFEKKSNAYPKKIQKGIKEIQLFLHGLRKASKKGMYLKKYTNRNPFCPFDKSVISSKENVKERKRLLCLIENLLLMHFHIKTIIPIADKIIAGGYVNILLKISTLYGLNNISV